MSSQTIRRRVARAAGSVVVAFGVSVGGAVTFAPPAHAMLPAEGGSSTKSLQRQYKKQLQRYQEEMQKSQRNWAMISDILKKMAELQRAITQNLH